MTDINLESVTKRYADKTVLDRVSLQVRRGEFVAILGPSGCGKTTLLRLLAGFEKPDGGTIDLGETRMADAQVNVPPEKRNVGIVFQNYALWPHMSVIDNVGYALKVAGVRGAERRRLSLEALSVVGLTEMADRAPGDLSGGQRQRVALARCLVARPSVMLLDEPLANLDVHLRASMERTFLDFHRRTGATMVYITHDQAEAMALADRIAVMDGGRIVQFAPPRELFREPRCEMVARFIGNGIILPARNIEPADGSGTAAVAEVFGTRHAVRAPAARRQAEAKLCVHPGEMQLAAEGEGFPATVERVVYRGDHTQIEFHANAMPDLPLSLRAPDSTSLIPGSVISVRIRDGWLLPAAA